MLLEFILHRIGAVYMNLPPPQQSTVEIPTIYVRILFQDLRALTIISVFPFIHWRKRVTGQGQVQVGERTLAVWLVNGAYVN